MAFNPAPTNFIASWSEDGTTVSFDIADVDQLSAEESDAVSGDARRVIFALVDKMFDYYSGLATADKPSKMSVSKSSVFNATTGQYRNTYTAAFDLDVTTIEVTDES